MASPTKQLTVRSPLKETDANQKGGTSRAATNELKRKSLDKLEHEHGKKKMKLAERSRSIEGAVLMNKQAALKKAEQHKVTPKDLLEWQHNWRKIMRRDTKMYFDTTDFPDTSTYTKQKLDRRKELLKRAFISLGAEITSFFDTDVTIVITRRTLKSSYSLPETDVLARAQKRYMKIWNYDKATRFLKNLDVDLETLEKSKNAITTPTLSNLLQNEKIYGPSDRDPRARRDDIHYFKYPYVYLYDLWQTWAPLITMEWKPIDLSDSQNLPYPSIKQGSFGRCPFIGDCNCDETSARRIIKRYKRDKLNKKYALHLRLLYYCDSTSQELSESDAKPMMIPHDYYNSSKAYQEAVGNDDVDDSLTAQFKSKSETALIVASNKSKEFAPTQQILKPPAKGIWKTPALNAQISLSRQETEEFADDLCKRKSRIPQEIKASGMNQSNDGATSFGNGLAPTKSSVLNKNMKSLNRLVIDKKTSTRALKPLETSVISASANTIDVQKKEESLKKEKKVVEAKKQEAKLGGGYCENCRVKYESLERHVRSEKHQSFAQDELNFEAIDSLIEKLHVAKRLIGSP